MAGIQLNGLSTGLDTESLIQGLMQVEQAPRARIVLQQAAANARKTQLQQVEDKLKALKLASDDLALPSGEKPVYCSDCFQQRGGGSRGGYGGRSGGRSRY